MRALLKVITQFFFLCTLIVSVTASQDEVDVLLSRLREGEGIQIHILCSVCYESMTDFSDDRLRNRYGLLGPEYPLERGQQLAGRTRAEAEIISVMEYGGGAIPVERRLSECNKIMRGLVIQLLRVEAIKTRNFFVLPNAPTQARAAALEQYITEVTSTDRFNCANTFAIAEERCDGTQTMETISNRNAATVDTSAEDHI